jgi:hypothetical protein
MLSCQCTETGSIWVWKPVAGAGDFVQSSNKIRDKNKEELLIIYSTIHLRIFVQTAS